MTLNEAKKIIQNFNGTMFIDGYKGEMSDKDIITIAELMKSLEVKTNDTKR